MSRTWRRCRATSGATCAIATRATLTAMTIDDLIARARGGDAKALAALLSTARYLGLGLGSVVNAIDPAHVYIGGEITAAWDLIEATVRAGLAERALTPPAGRDADHDRAARTVSAAARRRRAGRGAGVRRGGGRMKTARALRGVVLRDRRAPAPMAPGAPRRTQAPTSIQDRRPQGRCRCASSIAKWRRTFCRFRRRSAARARARRADDR